MSPPASGPGASRWAGRCWQRHASLLSRIEQRFGVPPEIIVAIWGLESDFGKGDIGKMPVIRTLATMAHDCRRTELFQGELLAALKIVQRGDLPLRDLIGAFAGEIGQTQFLPSSYIKYGVDFDGNGHVDLRHSVPDVLASTANLLHISAASKTARPTARAPRISRRCANGTGRRSIARPSAISPTGWRGGEQVTYLSRLRGRSTRSQSAAGGELSPLAPARVETPAPQPSPASGRGSAAVHCACTYFPSFAIFSILRASTAQ